MRPNGDQRAVPSAAVPVRQCSVRPRRARSGGGVKTLETKGTDDWGARRLFCLLRSARLAEPARPAVRPKLDEPGAVTITAGLVLFVLAITSIGERGFSTAVWVALVAGVVLLTAFVFVGRRHPEPLVRFGIFANRTVLSGNPHWTASTSSTCCPASCWRAWVSCRLTLSAGPRGVSASRMVDRGGHARPWWMRNMSCGSTMRLMAASRSRSPGR